MTNDIPLRSQFFSNRDGNTLMKEFEGILTNNPQRSRGQVFDLFTKKSKTCPSDLSHEWIIILIE
jgi:hypothetical protein